jgi:hypothetical protein
MDIKEQLVSYVKEWVAVDEDMKQLQSVMREKRKKKKELNDVLINIMKQNEIECFNTKNGKLLYSVSKTKKSITKKMLFETLQKYFNNDDDKVNEVASFILENRDECVKETIKRKDGKKELND